MSITRLPEIVFPLTQVNKVNEIVDVLNDNLNMYFSSTNPALTPVEGVCTWTVTHNLGTENVNCSLYNGDNLVISNVSITSDNVVTINFNSLVNIPAETYKIVIISNGAGSSSGSGSYVLPTASTTTLGGVRIDGSSITINNGVISSTVDSTLSDTSTNPVQNKVIYPSLNGFLPSGTIINVKTDGSGDFTSLADAINYLTGKWSNSIVTIQLGNGTFDITTISIDTIFFNIPLLIIRGSGISNTTLRCISKDKAAITVFDWSSVVFRNFTMDGLNQSDNICGIRPDIKSDVKIDNIKFQNMLIGIGALSNNHCELNGNLSFENVTYGIDSRYGGNIYLTESSTGWSFTNCNTAYRVSTGGQIHGTSLSVTYTNVTNKVSQTVGTATNNGWITGISV